MLESWSEADSHLTKSPGVLFLVRKSIWNFFGMNKVLAVIFYSNIGHSVHSAYIFSEKTGCIILQFLSLGIEYYGQEGHSSWSLPHWGQMFIHINASCTLSMLQETNYWMQQTEQVGSSKEKLHSHRISRVSSLGYQWILDDMGNSFRYMTMFNLFAHPGVLWKPCNIYKMCSHT